MKRLALIITLWAFSQVCQSQGLRIDLASIDREFRQKITVGEQIEYYRNLALSCEQQFGRLSYEFAATQSVFLDFYESVIPDWIRDTTKIYDTLRFQRKQLIPIIKSLYGDTSFLYAQAVTRYGLLKTNIWNKALSESERNELIDLFNGALSGIRKSKALTDTAIQLWVTILLPGKANIYYKTGDLKTMRVLLDSSIQLSLKYDLINSSFPGRIQWYASVLLKEDWTEQIEFLDKYDPLIWSRFSSSPKTLFEFRKGSLSHRITNSLFDSTTIVFLRQADSLCADIFNPESHEYALFILNYRLPILKKIGFKSAVFQSLAYLDHEIFDDNKLITNKDGLFCQYYFEWYKYLTSVDQFEKAVSYLKLAKKYSDTSFNRSTFETTISIYRELKDYYRFRSLDTCLEYAQFLIDLQERAQAYWGDRPIHEYHEMAKLFLHMETENSLTVARRYAELALSTFKSNYGTKSLYYKSALYTLGEIDFRETKGKNGIEKCWPIVYERLNDRQFIPPLSGGIFEAYARLLEKANRMDSADFFDHQTLIRNNYQSRMSVVGFGESLQLKSIREFKMEQSLIFSKHLERAKTKNHNTVSVELANLLAEKNQTLSLQLEYRNALQDAKLNKTEHYQMYESIRHRYDSMINQGRPNKELLDSTYTVMDSYKGWILEKYFLSPQDEKRTSKKQRLMYDYTWIKNNLKADEVYIDVCEFRVHDRELGFSNEPSFAFLLIDNKAGQSIPYYFKEESPELLMAIQDQAYDKISIYLNGLIDLIAPYKRCIIGADGWMSRVNFGALTAPDGGYLLEKKEFEYISDRSAIERIFTSAPKKGQALFMGNPTYRTNKEFESRNAGVFPAEFTSDQLEIPYTAQEIVESSQLLKNAGWSVKVFMDSSFNEARIRQIDNPTILHIATHGYYVEPDEIDNSILSQSENSYLRNGLILSAPSPKSSFDNIFSSFEMMHVNWSNISLAVLSACQTAQGDLKMGEGVFGIQRALQVAGVQQVILTTHAVFDKATQLLMRYFYEALLTSKTFSEALRTSQLKMIANPQFNKSKFWAPFILIHQ